MRGRRTKLSTGWVVGHRGGRQSLLRRSWATRLGLALDVRRFR
jgi:hypothetical protein